MTEIKVSLSLLVPGATMLSSQEWEENSKKLLNEEKIVVETKQKGKVKRETITIHTRKQRLVTQHIDMTQEAYQYMLNTPAEPKFIRIWNNLSKSERLKKHFDLIAHDLGAIKYSFEILDD